MQISTKIAGKANFRRKKILNSCKCENCICKQEVLKLREELTVYEKLFALFYRLKTATEVKEELIRRGLRSREA